MSNSIVNTSLLGVILSAWMILQLSLPGCARHKPGLYCLYLGSSTNIPDVTHENTHLALVDEERLVLIDGGGNPFVRLREAGLDEKKLTDIVMTHFHPDHVSGIPLLLMAVGLSDRKEHLDIYANEHCLGLMKQLLD